MYCIAILKIMVMMIPATVRKTRAPAIPVITRKNVFRAIFVLARQQQHCFADAARDLARFERRQKIVGIDAGRGERVVHGPPATDHILHAVDETRVVRALCRPHRQFDGPFRAQIESVAIANDQVNRDSATFCKPVPRNGTFIKNRKNGSRLIQPRIAATIVSAIEPAISPTIVK